MNISTNTSDFLENNLLNINLISQEILIRMNSLFTHNKVVVYVMWLMLGFVLNQIMKKINNSEQKIISQMTLYNKYQNKEFFKLYKVILNSSEKVESLKEKMDEYDWDNEDEDKHWEEFTITGRQSWTYKRNPSGRRFLLLSGVIDFPRLPLYQNLKN